MSPDNIDKGIRRYYKDQSLDQNVLDRLKTMAETQTALLEKNQINGNEKKNHYRKFALAAVLLIGVLTGTQLVHFIDTTDTDLFSRVTKEVELNHRKQLTSDFFASDYQTLASAMDKLDFSLKLPARLQNINYKLVGGRYCSIQGQIAAQIKLSDSEGRKLTLYATKLSDKLATLNNKSQLRGDVFIQMWKEGKLLFGLAGPKSSTVNTSTGK